MAKNKPWAEDEIEYLSEAWGNVPVKRIAAHLGRSVNAINIKVYKYGLGSFLDNGTEKNYVSKHQLMVALGITGGDSYKNISWIKNRGMPTHRMKRLNMTFRVIYIDEFWEWAEKNQALLDFSRFEKHSLGPEPDWVDEKRRRDSLHKSNYKTTPWTYIEDRRLERLLKEQKYSYIDLSKMLQRTAGAIQRRICDLNLTERPVKADNHINWTNAEWQTLADMIKQGCNYEEMQDVLGRSSKAIRGRVFDVYLTERLDKVREYIGSGNWGDGQPKKPLRYKRLMNPEEKEEANTKLSELAGMLLELAKSKSGVSEEYRDYFQKDMCMLWDEVIGCTAGEKSCDSCTSFQRIQPQFCVRCGTTFYERKQNKICDSCRKARMYQYYRKQTYLSARGRR